MKQKHFLLSLFLLFLIVFLMGRIGFVLYNSDTYRLTLLQTLWVWLTGLCLDVKTTALLLFVPALATLQKKISLRKLLAPYYLIVALSVSIIIVADTVMYEFWKFKLAAVILSYASSPEGTTNSVSLAFILSRLAAIVALTIFILTFSLRLTPKHTKAQYKSLLLFVLIALLPYSVGLNYTRNRTLFENHAATNPVYAFGASFDEERSFQVYDDAQLTELTQGLYPTDADDITDTLLRNTRPNILIIQMESFGGKFIKELGGLDDVAPNISRLIPQGIFFDRFYSSSFRTDRGSVSLQCGTISHPSISLMKEAQYHHLLPSLAASLSANGYQTSYLYAGAMTNMGKHQFLEDIGFQKLYDENCFTREELNSSWGADDQVSSRKLLQLIAETESTEQPWYLTYQTISSHEPWDVPYHRLADQRLNAFAFTDQCVGDLIDSLQHTPAWDNLLVIILPDHGYLYEQTYEDPEFFRAPMLWLGGAIKEPKVVHTLMNQSDIAATLLAQMGIAHANFPWSRNVLSAQYTHPFVYSNFPAGIMLMDDSGVSVFDLTARKPITEQPTPDQERIAKARAILQASYRYLHP